MESVLDSIAPTAPTASIDLDLVTGQYHDWHNQLVIPAIAGTRIVTCLYQVNKTTGKKLKESSYVRIPTAHLTDQTVKDNMSELLPFVTAYLQEIEDKIIKDEHKVGLTCVYSSGLSIAKIIDRLEADSTSGRLSKEVIQTWFADEILEKLGVVLSEKLSLDINDDKIVTLLAGYLAKFESLSNPKLTMKPANCQQLISLIAAIGESSLASKLTSKLEKLAKQNEDLLESLF